MVERLLLDGRTREDLADFGGLEEPYPLRTFHLCVCACPAKASSVRMRAGLFKAPGARSSRLLRATPGWRMLVRDRGSASGPARVSPQALTPSPSAL